MEIQSIKQRFGVIGDDPGLNRALETAYRVAPTDLSILVTGESGVGKETIPQIIHAYSNRKHGKYIAVNCGAIPEGTMDSELFGHTKGSFTGASAERKGYFEEADGGTIFLDEVAEMPMETQVKLLRVLEAGEFLKVGSSQIQKTNVRIVAATNVNIPKAIEKGKFREDLYYRLNTVPVSLPPLRKRKGDIHLLFRKFAYDFAEKYRMPGIRLSPDAVQVLENYYWHGNIRQLKNITEQISILESNREIDTETLLKYLPDFTDNNLPAKLDLDDAKNLNEREILYKIIFELRTELNQLKKVVGDIVHNRGGKEEGSGDYPQLYPAQESEVRHHPDIDHPAPYNPLQIPQQSSPSQYESYQQEEYDDFSDHEEVEETLSLVEKEKELIERALEKYNGKRRAAAKELGISERTLYRKIKEYDLN